MRRWWIALRVGHWMLAAWPLNPRRSYIDRHEPAWLLGVLVGASPDRKD